MLAPTITLVGTTATGKGYSPCIEIHPDSIGLNFATLNWGLQQNLFLGILREGTIGGGGSAIKVLQNLGIDLIAFEQQLRSALS